MNCPSCNTENPDGAGFCSQCGAALTPSDGEPGGDREEPTPGTLPESSKTELSAIFQTMEFAEFLPRLGAFAIDFLVVMIALTVAASILGALALMVWPAYFIYLTARSGQTLGKRVLGLKVVNDAGQVPRMRRLINRELYRFALFYFTFLLLFGQGPVLIGWIVLFVFITGHVAVAFDPMRRGWHDRLAKTYVVRVPRATYIPPPDN